MVGERASAFHHADGFDAHASTTDHFYIFEFFFDQFDNCIILGCCLNKFKEQTVFAIINDSGFEGFCNLKKFYFIGSSTFLDFDIKNLLKKNKNVCKINNFNDFYHTVELLFYLLKSFVITDSCDGHS